MNEYPLNDNDYEDHIIENVIKSDNGYEIRFDKCVCFYLPNPPIEPKIGMVFRQYPAGLGYMIRGSFINGKKVFYRTKKEQEDKHKQEIIESENKRQAIFEINKNKLDERFNSLPDVFQKRILKYRNANPNFRRDYEEYELFCCEQAILIANHFKSAISIDKWAKATDSKQKNDFPELSDRHSGNTFGCSCLLAKVYLTKPELVIEQHGALTPLVGCKEYGCPH